MQIPGNILKPILSALKDLPSKDKSRQGLRFIRVTRDGRYRFEVTDGHYAVIVESLAGAPEGKDEGGIDVINKKELKLLGSQAEVFTYCEIGPVEHQKEFPNMEMAFQYRGAPKPTALKFDPDFMQRVLYVFAKLGVQPQVTTYDEMLGFEGENLEWKIKAVLMGVRP